MVDSKDLKSYVKLLDYKFRVKYSRAKVKRIERQLSGVVDPDSVSKIFESEFYDQGYMDIKPIRQHLMYK